MKLYTVIPINKKTNKELPPRYDLKPMNHFAACNFMDSCRNSFTDYKICDWPDDMPIENGVCLASGYRRR